jgi:hypothetical protein
VIVQSNTPCKCNANTFCHQVQFYPVLSLL